MIEISSHIRMTRPVSFAPEHYTLDTKTTMGRLIQHLFNRGHYGRQVMDTVTFYERRQVRNEHLDAEIRLQMNSLLREGREPKKVLIGARAFDEFQLYTSKTHAMWTCQVSYSIPDSKNRLQATWDVRIIGLPATIVPSMEGVLVLDEYMLEVPSTTGGF